MKRLLCIVLLSAMTYCAVAQEKTNESVVEKMNAVISASSLEIQFVFTARSKTDEVLFDYSGTYFMQGDMYRISGGDYEVYCDSQRKYLYDAVNLELMILEDSGQENDITENPFAVLRDVNSRFDYRRDRAPKIKDNAYYLELRPLGNGSIYKKMVLSVDMKTYYPRYIMYAMENGDIYKAELGEIKPVAAKDASFFRFDMKSADDNLLIID